MRAALVLVLTLACMSAAQESYSGLDDDFVDQFNGEGSHTQMTYTEALRKAQRGMADYEVLDVFRSGLEEVKSSYNEQLKNDRKTNLAALLLDLANKEPDPGAWTSMYLEAEQLAKEVLQVFPYDDAARSNAAAARKSLNFRKGQLDRAVPGFMKEDLHTGRSEVFVRVRTSGSETRAQGRAGPGEEDGGGGRAAVYPRESRRSHGASDRRGSRSCCWRWCVFLFSFPLSLSLSLSLSTIHRPPPISPLKAVVFTRRQHTDGRQIHGALLPM